MEAPVLESYDIPEEYKDIFLIAQEKRSSKITVIEPINGGRSGAYLFAISELTNDGRTENLQHCILKLYQRKSTEKDEYENLRIAHSKEPAFGKKHIATLNGYPIESKGRTAVFYNIAGNSLQQCRPVSSYVDSPKSLKAIFSKISNSILEEWNVQIRFSRLTYPQQFLKEWLGYRIKPGQGNIARFLEENFKVNSNEPGLIIDGIVVPNPFAYACEQGLWGDVEKIDPARGYLHGDLNINNILVSFTRDGELKEYQLIDFAKFEVESFLFYDHLYLEMSYLIELIANAKVPFEQWKKLIFILAQEDMPDPERVPTNMMGACVALVSSRHMFDDWLNSKHPNLRDHFWGQFRLAAVAAGLNFCNKTGLSPKERWAAFVYAAAHLKRYCDLFDVVKPNQAKELILADDDLSIDPGQDWQPFLEACHNFDNEHLFILVVGPEDNPDKSLAPLGRIGWSVVIDFDQDTQTNGIYKAISSEGSKHRSLHIVTREDQNELSLNPVYGTYWYAAHGLTGRANTLPSDNTYRKWSQTYTSVFRRFLANLAATSQELPITVVVTWDAVQFISKVCELFDEIFIDRVEFVFASYTGEALRNVANLYNATIFRLNLYQIAAGVSSVIGPNSNNDQAAILLPSHVQGNKDAQVEIPRETANWLHEELTLVHLNLGLFQESDYEPGYNFLRGNIISWFELGLDIDIKRDKTESLERQVRFDLENGNISRINLYHYPGAGGTTIARRIAWSFHKKFPTILVNQISLLGTIERLSSLYKFVDKPILAIVEHTGFQKETLDTLFASVRARTLPIVFLVVSRKLDSITETERIKYLPELLIEREPERFARVYSKEALLGRASKVNDLASNQAMRKLRTPFYFGLTAFEEKFLQLPTYVAARLDGMTDLERKIMCYLALTHYYTQMELPAQIFGNLIGRGEYRIVILQNALDKERIGLLVYVSEKRGWRTAHYTIAHEICKQIIGGSIEGGKNWKHHLANWAIEYIQYFGALNLNSDRQHSDFVIDLMEEMFISRNAINLDTTKKTGSFARPIIDIQTKEGELAVLQCLADSFENQPHFRAHYARMLSQQGRHKEAQIEARKAAKIQSHDRVLHHILGIVLRKDIYEIMLSVERNKRRRVEIDDQRLIDIENLFQEAENSFARAREIDIEHEHSYTSHAEMLIRAVEFGFKLSDKETYKEFFSDQKLSKYHEMVDKAENLLAVAKKLYEASTPSSYLVSCENRIDEFFSNDYQSIIRNWRKMLDTNASDVHAPTIRRRIIRLHLAKNGRYWDDMPISELEDTLILTEQNILEEPENDWNVRLWFEAARRLPDVSVDLAIDRLTSLQARNDTVEILYYLYILQTLKAIDGSYVAKERAEKLMEECHKRILPLSLADQKFRYNWLGTEEGLPRIVYFKKLGKLNEQDWFKYDDDKILARIPGKVAKISSPKAGWVELRCGLRAFFTPGHERDARSYKGFPLIEGFVKGRDENIDVDFYLGFSYDGLRAYEVKKVEL